MKIDLYAPIQPGISLGGISVGTPESSILKEITNFRIDRNFEGETAYYCADGCLVIGVNTSTGLVFRVSAMENYRGTLLESYYLGMPISDFLKIGQDWRYSEEQAGFLHCNLKGVIICVDLEDASFEEACDDARKIGEIAIFNEDYF